VSREISDREVHDRLEDRDAPDALDDEDSPKLRRRTVSVDDIIRKHRR
jgi:hypothetical protein